MKSESIIRRADALGRIVLPSSIRRKLDISPGDYLEISTDQQSVVLQKHVEGCIFCERTDLLTEFHGKPVCELCLANLKEI